MKERRCQRGQGDKENLGESVGLGVQAHLFTGSVGFGVYHIGARDIRFRYFYLRGMWCSGFSHICPEVLLTCPQQSLALEPLCAELGSPSGSPWTPMHWWGVLKGPISGQSLSVRISISGVLSPLDPLSLGVSHHQDPHLWQSLPSPWSCFLRVSLHVFCPWGWWQLSQGKR